MKSIQRETLINKAIDNSNSMSNRELQQFAKNIIHDWGFVQDYVVTRRIVEQAPDLKTMPSTIQESATICDDVMSAINEIPIPRKSWIAPPPEDNQSKASSLWLALGMLAFTASLPFLGVNLTGFQLWFNVQIIQPLQNIGNKLAQSVSLFSQGQEKLPLINDLTFYFIVVAIVIATGLLNATFLNTPQTNNKP